MLPVNYKRALFALKKQAQAVTGMLPGDTIKKNVAQIQLGKAQQEMHSVDAECRHIIKLLMNSKDRDITIPTMTETQLAELLEHK